MGTFEGYYQESATNGIIAEINRQSQYIEEDPNPFKCSTCCNYKGALKCGKGIFIAFEGANLSGCFGYEEGNKCRHCGRIT